MQTTIYEAVGGGDVLLALAHAWHRRCLDDPVASHPFSHPGHPQHLERLAAYWGEALGGPPAYSSTMGDHTHVMRMHAGNGDHPELDERVVALFHLAMADAEVPEAVRPVLADYFREMTVAMAQYPISPDDVPAGLAFPHWSWDGRPDD